MLYERLLDLAPSMRLERRLAERVAARLVIGLLLSLPICGIAAAVLVSGAIHAVLVGIWDAGRIAGLWIRDGLDGRQRPVDPAASHVHAPCPGTHGRIRGW